MENKNLNSQLITLLKKLNKSLDETARNGSERVDILENKIDHIMMMFDQLIYSSDYLKHLGKHPLSKKNIN